MAEEHPIPIIAGPTASGKTAVAVELAKTCPIEVISADSRQIIRKLDIGTAKPTDEERRQLQFHLVDIIEPGDRYSAFRFVEDADRAIQDILSRGKQPIVVGGTGLYLRALTEGVVEIEEDRHKEIREKLEVELEKIGPEKMHARLTAVDPEEAACIHPNNRVRVLRALEMFELTGVPKSELVTRQSYKKSKYSYAGYCLAPPREELYATIEHRVDVMISEGLLEEASSLVEQGLRDQIRRANVIGYDELLDHLEGHQPLSEAVALIKQNTRRYAKRQMTWFRHQTDFVFFPDRKSLIESIRKAIYIYNGGY